MAGVEYGDRRRRAEDEDPVSHYAVEIDLSNPNTSHSQVVGLVGRNKSVLDVGCWNGDLGRALITNGCTVTGVEIDSTAAAVAETVLESVVVADLDSTPLPELVGTHRFDVVVMADVLEHLRDPRAVLEQAAALLRPGGYLVISLPNVTHGSVRLALLQGRWDYTETGLLDRTHLTFFSRRGLLELLRNAGYVVDDLRGTVADPLNVEVVVDATVFPAPVVEWVRDQPDSSVYQFVFTAHPSPDSADAVAPLLSPVVPQDGWRLQDASTQRATADLDARRRMLTVRDHIIGLEAAAATAQHHSGEVERQLRQTKRRVAEREQTIKRLRQRVRELEQAPGAAAGASIPRRVGRRVKRLVASPRP